MSDPRLIKHPDYINFVKRYSADLPRFAKEVCGLDLTWQQDEVCKSVQDFGSRVTISSGHGCFGIGTKIMLSDGNIRNVEDIVVGDQLMGDDGTVRNVLELYRGRENLYRFTYSDGSSHVFNESHILCVCWKEDTKYKYTVKVKEWLSYGKCKQSKYVCYKIIDNNVIPLPIKEIVSLGVGNYYGFELDGNHKFLGGDFTVLHNTGKTASFGVIALWHLTCFYGSITAIVAPNINQVRKQVFKEISLSLNRMKKGHFKWVADEVELLKQECYIKGAQEYWHVLAKTAPKGEPENLAGLHADYLLIIVDEASGVEDSHFGVLTGALTDGRNRMLIASQPTRNVGFFYDTHHELSTLYGGSWVTFKLNSEESPIVSEEFILEKKKQYSKEQYAIKVRGEFPNKSDGFLLGRSEIDATFGYNPLKKNDEWGYIIPIDVGGGDFRDDSVLTVAKVCGYGLFGDNARRVYIDEIPIVSDRMDTVRFARESYNRILEYYNATTAIDFGGMGGAFIHNLNDLGLPNIVKVKWGNPCFRKEYRDMFFNLRAQAVVSMARAIQEGRFGINSKVVDKYGSRIITELTRIPYGYDNKARYQIMPKEDMRAKGIPSPDIGDTFAFCFLEGVDYMVNEGQNTSDLIPESEATRIEEQFEGLDDFFN